MTREQRCWADLCNRLQRDPATSEKTDTCTLRVALKHALAFADAEAAAMRERAAMVVEAAVTETQRGAIQAMRPYYTGPEQARVDMGCDLMAAIRSLPSTGEVGRG